VSFKIDTWLPILTLTATVLNYFITHKLILKYYYITHFQNHLWERYGDVILNDQLCLVYICRYHIFCALVIIMEFRTEIRRKRNQILYFNLNLLLWNLCNDCDNTLLRAISYQTKHSIITYILVMRYWKKNALETLKKKTKKLFNFIIRLFHRNTAIRFLNNWL